MDKHMIWWRNGHKRNKNANFIWDHGPYISCLNSLHVGGFYFFLKKILLPVSLMCLIAKQWGPQIRHHIFGPHLDLSWMQLFGFQRSFTLQLVERFNYWQLLDLHSVLKGKKKNKSTLIVNILARAKCHRKKSSPGFDAVLSRQRQS